MEMPISCGICPKISPDGNIRPNQERYRTNTSKVVWTKGGRDHRSTSMSGSYSYSLTPWSEKTFKRILQASIVLLWFIWKHVSIIVLKGIIFSSIKTYLIKKLLKLWSEILAASSLHRSTISALWSNFRSDVKSLVLIPETSKIGASFSRWFRWIAWTIPLHQAMDVNMESISYDCSVFPLKTGYYSLGWLVAVRYYCGFQIFLLAICKISPSKSNNFPPMQAHWNEGGADFHPSLLHFDSNSFLRFWYSSCSRSSAGRTAFLPQSGQRSGCFSASNRK